MRKMQFLIDILFFYANHNIIMSLCAIFFALMLVFASY